MQLHPELSTALVAERARPERTRRAAANARPRPGSRCPSSEAATRQFAAQFSLSHACWLATYPIAGVLGAALGLGPTAWLLAAVAALAVALAARAWSIPEQKRPPVRELGTVHS